MDLKGASLVCNAVAINGAATVYSNSFKMGHIKNLTAMALAGTATTPAIKVQLEVSWQLLSVGGATNYNEGASSIYYVVPDAFPDVFSDIVDKTYHAKGVYPPYAVYGRYKITGLSGNPSDAVITIYNMIQELGRTYGA